jgi:hypothetical protein
MAEQTTEPDPLRDWKIENYRKLLEREFRNATAAVNMAERQRNELAHRYDTAQLAMVTFLLECFEERFPKAEGE